MKIELDRAMVNDLKDKLMVSFLIDDLETLREYQDLHPDDIKYNKKLAKAYLRILNYYGQIDDIE